MCPSNYIQKLQNRTKPGNELGFSAWIKWHLHHALKVNSMFSSATIYFLTLKIV